jgi:4-amino-4-deoxy-L-arabinose transferase-like glycosyltransferase
LRLAAVLYCWRLPEQGWGNAYYAAAAQAGATSWKVMLFGGIDPAGAMSTDKPPLALWVLALSTRALGLGWAALFLPQVVASLISVMVLERTVRRCWGAPAGLVAATVMAVIPVFAVLARFDDPDTLLVMLLTTAAYATVRATEDDGRAWLLAIGALAGAAS